MTTTRPPGQHLISLFTQTPCWMIKPLAAEMQYSIPSVRRFLAEAGYYSSFTHNGGWYTLRSIPRFGKDGLWFYRDIGFSRTGTLTKTLISLITRSPAGMSAEMLGETLRCRCHGFLVNLWRKGKIERQKIGRCQVYFAADPHKAANQRQALAALASPGGKVFSRDCSPGSGRVYPRPRFKFRAIGGKSLPKQGCDREWKTNRTAFRSTRSKKNDADCGARALKALALYSQATVDGHVGCSTFSKASDHPVHPSKRGMSVRNPASGSEDPAKESVDNDRPHDRP